MKIASVCSMKLGPPDRRNGRFAVTVGFGSSGPKPGIKYVYQDALAETVNFRFTQRFTYDLGEGGHGSLSLRCRQSTAQLARAGSSLTHAFLYGEKTEANRVVNQLVLRPRLGGSERPRRRQLATYVGADGQAEPDDLAKNYKLGMRIRRQAL